MTWMLLGVAAWAVCWEARPPTRELWVPWWGGSGQNGCHPEPNQHCQFV